MLVPRGRNEHMAVFWARRDRCDTDGAEADLRGMIDTLLPEAREQAEHVEGPAQLRQTTSIAKGVPSLMYAIADRSIIEDN